MHTWTFTERQTDRKRQRQRQRNRDRDKQRETERDKHTHARTHAHTHTHTHTHTPKSTLALFDISVTPATQTYRDVLYADLHTTRAIQLGTARLVGVHSHNMVVYSSYTAFPVVSNSADFHACDNRNVDTLMLLLFLMQTLITLNVTRVLKTNCATHRTTL